MPTNNSTTQTDVTVVRIAVSYSVMLAALLPLVFLSLYGQLFGPQWTGLFGLMGFVSAMAVFGLSRSSLGKRFIHTCPNGLSDRFIRLRRLEIVLRSAMRGVGLVAAIGLVTLAATARFDGVSGTPVFAHREHYILVDHSIYTEVSRFRYCLAGAGFHVAWHFGALYAMLLAIYALLFARILNEK